MGENVNTETNESNELPSTCGDLIKYLDDVGIEYEVFDHEPIFTVEEGLHLKANIPGVHCRNLFMRDKKKNNYLLTLANETEVDLKKLSDVLGIGRLSFGSAERLWEHLGIRPGSVNPFCVMNDPDNQVTFFLDALMMKAETVNYHPMDNAKTIGLSPADLINFIESLGHNYTIVDLSPAKP